MARIPQDATHDVQRSIQDLNNELDRVDSRLRALDQGLINSDIDAIRAILEKVRKDIIKPKSLDFNDVFRPSGPAHAIGYVPDPGPTAAASKFLREDATWAAAGGGTVHHSANFTMFDPPIEDSFYPLMVATAAVTVVGARVIHSGGSLAMNLKKNHRSDDTDLLPADLYSAASWESGSAVAAIDGSSLSIGDEVDVKLIGVSGVSYVVVQVDYTEP
jgi:hypothetical protein